MPQSIEIGSGSGGVGISTARLAITNVASAVGKPDYDVPVMVNSNSGFSEQYINLSSGVNTITVPANASAAWLKPPLANAVTMTLKGSSGDAGIALHLIGWQLVTLAASQTSFVITTGGVINGFVIVWI